MGSAFDIFSTLSVHYMIYFNLKLQRTVLCETVPQALRAFPWSQRLRLLPLEFRIFADDVSSCWKFLGLYPFSVVMPGGTPLKVDKFLRNDTGAGNRSGRVLLSNTRWFDFSSLKAQAYSLFLSQQQLLPLLFQPTTIWRFRFSTTTYLDPPFQANVYCLHIT